MQLKTALVSLLAPALLATAATLSPEPREAPPEPGTIHVVEHPGYFETRGSTYEIEAGTYTFVVENRSGKDAGFVLAPEKGEPTVVGIANGETGTVEVELTAGRYTYFCPLIPTPPYPLSVK